MRVSLLFPFFVTSFACNMFITDATEQTKISDYLIQRQSKYIPLLAYVTFTPDFCRSSRYRGETGICLKRSACEAKGGAEIGSCASGYGVCCEITAQCSSNPVIVRENGTRLVKGERFQDYCGYEILRRENVCQVRLDFRRFDLYHSEMARMTGNCDEDTFTITGFDNGKLGPLCGNLDGQHLYLNFGTKDRIVLGISLIEDQHQDWDIYVTMISCGSPLAAPEGCMQMHSSAKGQISSLNFNNNVQLNRQTYTICVRKLTGMKKVLWAPCSNASFFISGGKNDDEEGMGSPDNEAQHGDICKKDYIMFYGDNKYCGKAFLGAVQEAQPFMLQVNFDEVEFQDQNDSMESIQQDPNSQTDFNNIGFCFNYKQTV